VYHLFQQLRPVISGLFSFSHHQQNDQMVLLNYGKLAETCGKYFHTSSKSSALAPSE
jgi:hypothetical protein